MKRLLLPDNRHGIALELYGRVSYWNCDPDGNHRPWSIELEIIQSLMIWKCPIFLILHGFSGYK